MRGGRGGHFIFGPAQGSLTAVSLTRIVSNFRHVMLQDGQPASNVRQGHDDVSVETAWSDQSLVKRLREVCGTDESDTLSLGEAVELHEEFVEGCVGAKG